MSVAQAKRKQARIVSLYQKVFTSPDGRAILIDMIRGFHVMKSNFHENPNIHAFQEGQRDVVLTILKTLKIDHAKIMDEVRQLELEDGR